MRRIMSPFTRASTLAACGLTLLASTACEENSNPKASGAKLDVVPANHKHDATTSTSTQTSAAPVQPLAQAIISAPDTQYPTKQLPLPISEKANDPIAAATDPTLLAFRILLENSVNTFRLAPAPFQLFALPDPLAATASLPLRPPVKDAQAPVHSTTGRPLPVLK